MVARLRPTRTTPDRHRNTARGSAYRRGHRGSPRGFAGQDDRNSRGDGPTFAALRRLRLRNWPTPLAKPNWSETPSLDSAACCLGLPCSPQIRPSFRYVPSAGTQIHWLRAGATMPGTMPADPARLEIGYAAELSCRSASGTSHNTHCPFGRSSHINSFRADNSPCRDPSARNLCQTMCRCVLSRCFTVTLTANPHLRARAGSHRASSQASFTPTPPLRLECEQPGLRPKPPPILIARLLPSPRRLRSPQRLRRLLQESLNLSLRNHLVTA